MTPSESNLDAKTSLSIRTLVAWGGALLLLALHLHFWVDAGPLLLMGWLPVDLAYRIAWLMLAWVYMIFFCKMVWREDT